ncbi:MAG: complex I subunit 4 family protein [Bacilli bacterium]
MNASIILLGWMFSPLLLLAVISFVKKDAPNVRTVGRVLAVVPTFFAALAMVVVANGAQWTDWATNAKWFAFGDVEFYEQRLFEVGFNTGLTPIGFILMVLASVLLIPSVFSIRSNERNVKGMLQLIFILQLGMLGVFAAQNLFLFFLFFELTFVSTFFLISKWGGVDRERTGWQFLIYNGIGSALMLLVFVVLFAATGTGYLPQLVGIMSQPMEAANNMMLLPLSETVRSVLFWMLVVAFGIKLPIVPLHRWMVSAHEHAPIPAVILHAGVLLKIGAYGLYMFALLLFSFEWGQYSNIILVFGVVNLLYGAFLAFRQTDFRRVLAYSSVSHMGIVIAGLAASSFEAIEGAFFQTISHGLIAALMFFIVGEWSARTGTTTLARLGGMSKVSPFVAGMLLATGMASLGLPGTSGFVGEFTVFAGWFAVDSVTASVGALALILTAAYVLRAIMGVVFGATTEETANVGDVSVASRAIMVGLFALIVLLGVMPNLIDTFTNPIAILQSLLIGG